MILPVSVSYITVWKESYVAMNRFVSCMYQSIDMGMPSSKSAITHYQSVKSDEERTSKL